MARHFALILALGLAGAARPDDTVTCKDGTTAKAGKGACSGHGGVDKKATPQPAEAKEARDAKASKPKKDADGGDAPMVACKDGTTSRGGKGACSGHGGVDKKAKEPPQAKSPAPAASAPAPQGRNRGEGHRSRGEDERGERVEGQALQHRPHRRDRPLQGRHVLPLQGARGRVLAPRRGGGLAGQEVAGRDGRDGGGAQRRPPGGAHGGEAEYRATMRSRSARTRPGRWRRPG
jgi:hypothetical protein